MAGCACCGESPPQRALRRRHFTRWSWRERDAERSAAGAGSRAFIAVLAATGNSSGIPFHVKAARKLGASRAEVLSAVLLALPAVGNTVIAGLPVALEAYDGEDKSSVA